MAKNKFLKTILGISIGALAITATVSLIQKASKPGKEPSISVPSIPDKTDYSLKVGDELFNKTFYINQKALYEDYVNKKFDDLDNFATLDYTYVNKYANEPTSVKPHFRVKKINDTQASFDVGIYFKYTLTAGTTKEASYEVISGLIDNDKNNGIVEFKSAASKDGEYYSISSITIKDIYPSINLSKYIAYADIWTNAAPVDNTLKSGDELLGKTLYVNQTALYKLYNGGQYKDSTNLATIDINYTNNRDSDPITIKPYFRIKSSSETNIYFQLGVFYKYQVNENPDYFESTMDLLWTQIPVNSIEENSIIKYEVPFVKSCSWLTLSSFKLNGIQQNINLSDYIAYADIWTK